MYNALYSKALFGSITRELFTVTLFFIKEIV